MASQNAEKPIGSAAPSAIDTSLSIAPEQNPSDAPATSHVEGAVSDGASSDRSSSTFAPSPAYPLLSLATAGQGLSAVGASSTDASVDPSVEKEATLPSSQLFSSPALPSDTKELAQPVLITPVHDSNAQFSPQKPADPTLLGVEAASGSSTPASASPSVISGTSTPARSAANELHLYAQRIQQQLLNQRVRDRLHGGSGQDPSSTPPLLPHQHGHLASANASAYNSPPESGRSSPNLSGSTRSQRTPRVLETRRLDIQTHTSGRRMVNQYLIEGELGRGVHGKVRLARDLETGERVAVKIVEREARKRLGAGLGLLNRNNRRKISFPLSGPAHGLESPPNERQQGQDAQSSNVNEQAQQGSDSPHDETDSASTSTSTAVKVVSSTTSTQFAPLPDVQRPEQSDMEAERRREKEREKARKALLWTTDQKVRREIAIMKKCSHQNVVQLKEVIDDPQSKKIFMVLEYMQGGEVVWKDEQGLPTLTVDEARCILRDVVCGLEYLHYQGIIHRDIKPANLLCDKDRRVKISDFGVSHFSYAMMIASDQAAAATAVSSSASSSSSRLGQPSGSTSDPSLMDDRELAKTAGSPAFFAPELCMSSFSSTSPSIEPVSNRASLADAASGKISTAPIRPKVTKAIDVWALGVTLYCLLFGTTPFTAECEYALFAVIPNTDYSLPTFMGSDRVRVGPRKQRWQSHSQWTDEEADAQPASPSELCPDADPDSLSEDARQLRDLMDRLLEKDPTKRITLEEVKKHPWVTRGLQDAPAWLSETDPQHLPYVEISHADVEDALTGFSKLKQRVKRWQSKLFDSFVGGRRRSKSVNHSSASSSIHADARTDSGDSSLHQSRQGTASNAISSPAIPFDSSSQSGPSTSSVRTPRTPLKGPAFFGLQKSTSSVGRRDGGTTLRALTSAHPDEDADFVASGSPAVKASEYLGTSPLHTSPRTFEESVAEAHDRVSTLSPVMPPPVLVDSIDHDTMKTPGTVAQRRASAQSSSSAGLRPDPGPQIPQRTSSDTHGAAARRVSATSASSSFHTSSPHMPSMHRMPSRRESGSNDSHSRRAASPRRSFDSEGRSSTLSISQTSRVSGRHRLGGFLRGSWLMNGGDDRNRSSSRPSTRGSRDAQPFSSGVGNAGLAKRSGSIRSTASVVKPGLAPPSALGPLSVDTQGAIRQTGVRAESGTPTSAPVLGSNSNSALTGSPSLSTELLTEPIESSSLARSAFSAASQPSSPLSDLGAVQPFAFDSLGRRRHVTAPLDTIDLETDDVDLELELSDDDLYDDLDEAGGARGPMLVNSGNGWTVRNDEDTDGGDVDDGGAAFLPEAYVRKGSSGSESSNGILTPSVEGGYNVYKPPYQHILSPPESSVPNESGITAATDLSGTNNVAATSKAPNGAQPAAPACQTFAMDATLSTEAAALRKGETPSVPVAEESQFADADEEAPRSDEPESVAANLAQTVLADEDDEDSDEQCVSFQARRKRSTRFHGPPASAA
ncbi:related to Serine/threonine-protein kinase [Ustilago bromivora]|uniref:Related to Serine/threonine-protein kinase n=1 Tax=Ustilago bromivora TaxID=307758 RepID=A0A1K0G0G4_9BASI|nr:related to Serine/threonine-protein kinase [Ustilago bromivora]SYW78252.1 related to Serine/threonine-protein kinase [Ustilago bromivora]